MAAVDIGAQNAPHIAAADDLDDLFDYDVGDVFRDVDTNMDAAPRQKVAVQTPAKENTLGLGIDEEINVAKKRAPVPKLDEDRLLGPAGIPKLRRITKERLKFKGKGHEYSDVARLLNLYQLWLDDLYPRAKFADGLAIIEKLGHKKRMQIMRREWINEGRPKETMETIEDVSQNPAIRASFSENTVEDSIKAVSTNRPETPSATQEDDEDFYSATPNGNRKEGLPKSTESANQDLFVSDDEDMRDHPPEDDLDAILGEHQAEPTPKDKKLGTSKRFENFDDEMEVMTGMDDFW